MDKFSYGRFPITLFDEGKKQKEPHGAYRLTPFLRYLRERIQRDGAFFILDGKYVRSGPCWVRDYIHEMKGWIHWEPDTYDFIDYLLEHQHPDGYFYEIGCPQDDPHIWMVDEHDRYIPAPDEVAFCRLELEADIEYLMVEGCLRRYRSTGDDAWMQNALPKLEKGIDYMTSDPKRWSKELGLCIRPRTIDTWDFVDKEGTDFDRRIHENEPMVVMHGDNTGVYAAMQSLAWLNDRFGHPDKAASWRERAETLKANLNKHCWNGDFYRHWLCLDGNDDPEEERRMSLSCSYDMNRGILTAEQARRTLAEYQRRREQTDGFAEWFSLDPPYPQFFIYPAGDYINGSLTPIAAGEIAHAAFLYGEEFYGWNTLMQMMDIQEREGEIRFMYDPKTGKDLGGGPSGWAAGALVYAIEEGLAGIVDTAVCYEEIDFAPRWLVTELSHVAYVTGYAASHTLVETVFDREDDALRYAVTAPARVLHCHLWVPEGRQVKRVTVNGQPVAVTPVTVGNSRYVDFDVQTGAAPRTTYAAYEAGTTTTLVMELQ